MMSLHTASTKLSWSKPWSERFKDTLDRTASYIVWVLGGTKQKNARNAHIYDDILA